MAIKEYSVDLDIKGRVLATDVPNSTGSIVTWNANTNVFGLRTNTQIISDLNLSSNFVPYTGATANVNLGTRSITSSGGFIGNATTATTLATARTINGTSFNGSANITTARWGTARNITIGDTTKSVNGSGNVSWSLAEIGAIPLSGTEVGSPVTGGIEFDGYVGDALYFPDPTSITGAYSSIFNEDGDTELTGYDGTHYIQFNFSGGNTQFFGIYGDNPSFRGLEGSAYYGANYDDNTYVQKKYVDDNASTGLEAIDEGNGIGWRLKGANPDNYGNIGRGAIDLGSSDLPSTTVGATGPLSNVSGGLENIASGGGSTVGGGVNNEATSNHSTVGGGLENTATGSQSTVSGGYKNSASNSYSTAGGGYQNEATGSQSTVSGGLENEASGDYSTVSGGVSNIAKTLGEFLGGLWSTIKEGNATTWVGTDRIFGIGNGKSESERSDAFNVYKNGVAELPSVNNLLINAAGPKTIPTKEWANSNFDKYTSWNLKTNGVQRTTVQSGGDLDLIAGTGLTNAYSAGGVITHSFDTAWGDGRYSLIGHTHTFASLTSKPTTISGYGITDFNSLGDARWALRSRTLTAGNGLSGGGNLTANRTFTLGTPSAITLSSTNSVATSSHTHAFTPGGTTAQYIRGDGSLATIPTNHVTTSRTITAGNGLSGGGTLAANRTITLGTPTAIGLSTTNSVTSTSHTHALDSATTTAINNGNTAFGWGDFKQQISITDIHDEIPKPSLFKWGGEPLNGTGLATNGTGIDLGGNGNRVQRIFVTQTGRMFFQGSGSLPTSLREVISDSNLDSQATSLGFIKSSALPTVNNGQLTLSTGTGLNGSATFTANQSGSSAFSVAVASTHKLPTTAEWNALPTANTITRLRGTTSGTFTSGDLTLLAGANTTITQSGANITIASTNTNTTYSAGTGLSLTGTTFANTAPNATHTGDVTGATALTIANSAVTHAKYQNIPTQRILGRGATGTGNVQELTLGDNLSLSTAGVLSATNTNTTYSAGTLALLNTGTNTSNRVWSSKILNDWLVGKNYVTASIINGLASETWVTTQLSSYVPTSRTITAGNGLSGGGNLTANRTITLGTPTAIGLSTTNSVTSTSHTHALDAVTTTAINNGNTAFGWGNFRDYGLGNTGARTIDQLGGTDNDWNTLPHAINGFVFGSNTSLNYPGAANEYPIGLKIGWNTNIGATILVGRGSIPELRFRPDNSTNSYPWARVWHDVNLPNPATQTWVTQQINNISIPTVNNGQLTLSTGTGLNGSATFTANQSGSSAFSVAVASTHKLPTTAEWNALSTQTLSNSTSNLIVSNTVQRAALTGDVTASQNSNATTIANSAVTHAKYQNIATQRILGRGATGTGNVQELTLGDNLSLSTGGVLSATDTTYSVFSTGNVGLVPARIGTAVTKYLREDGAWVIPTNTTYSEISVAQINSTTSSAARLITGRRINAWIDTKGFATENWVTSNFDNYQSWNLKTDGVQRTTVQSGGDLDLIAGDNITLSYNAGGKVTIKGNVDPFQEQNLQSVTDLGNTTNNEIRSGTNPIEDGTYGYIQSNSVGVWDGVKRHTSIEVHRLVDRQIGWSDANRYNFPSQSNLGSSTIVRSVNGVLADPATGDISITAHTPIKPLEVVTFNMCYLGWANETRFYVKTSTVCIKIEQDDDGKEIILTNERGGPLGVSANSANFYSVHDGSFPRTPVTSFPTQFTGRFRVMDGSFYQIL